MVNRGLIMAPTVTRPDRSEQTFACLPYSINSEYLTTKKTILDKALAIVACVRCGEHFGGVTAIHSPARILGRLLDPDSGYSINPHSSSRRQYQLLFKMQVVDFEPSGHWVKPRLIPTQDNREAVQLALDLLAFGEQVRDRIGGEDDARALLV